MTGIIPIDKPKDITSFGVVAKMRGITKEKKAGHTGTLDPMATGALPILFGGATRFLELLPDHNKGYRAKLKLGITTDTLDITGNILSEKEVNTSLSDFESVLPDFRGNISQIPPMFSAVSVDGKRLYDLARQGLEVERKPRQVTVEKLELVNFNEQNNEYEIDVVCSKGTYIRAIVDDIGKKLGCGAVMTDLRRTLAMGFSIDRCVTIEQMQHRKDENIGFDDILVSVEETLKPYDAVTVSEPQSVRFSNGGGLDLVRVKKEINHGELYRVYSPNGLFLGLGQGDFENNQLAVKRLLVKRD